jgi:hypothetical protein
VLVRGRHWSHFQGCSGTDFNEQSVLRGSDSRVKRSVKIALFALAGLIAIVFAWAADEVLIFVSSTAASAQEEAKIDFLRECAHRRLDPTEFAGPVRIESPPRTYGFVWVNASNGNQIATMVSYFPAGVESWLSRQHDGKYVPYCDEKSTACH